MSAVLTPRNAAIKVLEKASEYITYEEKIYEIHVLQKINRGSNDQLSGAKTKHNSISSITPPRAHEVFSLRNSAPNSPQLFDNSTHLLFVQ